MTLLTEQQMAEVVEAMARSFKPKTASDGAHPMRFPSPDEVEAGFKADLSAALTAALPAIERAVLERAAEAAVPAAVPLEWMEDPNWPHILEGMRRSREIVRALAGEVG